MGNNVDYTRIIRYLEELGFDVSDKNIYCYVLVISRVANIISKVDNDGDVNILLPLIMDLKNPESDFYKALAKSLKMDLITLHWSLRTVIDNIDYEKANKDLYECLFCRIYTDVDYGEFALVLASQMLGRLTVDTYINEERPKIKHLSIANKKR